MVHSHNVIQYNKWLEFPVLGYLTKCCFLKRVNVKDSFDVVMVNTTLLLPYKHE